MKIVIEISNGDISNIYSNEKNVIVSIIDKDIDDSSIDEIHTIKDYGYFSTYTECCVYDPVFCDTIDCINTDPSGYYERENKKQLNHENSIPFIDFEY